jgi:hypothetical protein
LEEDPKIPKNPENTLTQEGRIKYTSQGEDSSLDQEYNPLITIIVNTEVDQEDSNTSLLLIPKGRGRLKGSKNKLKALELLTIRLGLETPS